MTYKSRQVNPIVSDYANHGCDYFVINLKYGCMKQLLVKQGQQEFFFARVFAERVFIEQGALSEIEQQGHFIKTAYKCIPVCYTFKTYFARFFKTIQLVIEMFAHFHLSQALIMDQWNRIWLNYTLFLPFFFLLYPIHWRAW